MPQDKYLIIDPNIYKVTEDFTIKFFDEINNGNIDSIIDELVERWMALEPKFPEDKRFKEIFGIRPQDELKTVIRMEMNLTFQVVLRELWIGLKRLEEEFDGKNHTKSTS